MNKNEFLDKMSYEIERVIKLQELFKNRRRVSENYWRLIDSYDSGQFWDTMRKKLPKHQIIPDTNLVFDIAHTIVNSVYSAPYIADVLPLDAESQDEARNINKFLEYEYNRHELGYKQLRMGNRAARLNVGFMQIGWDSSSSFKVGDKVMKGELDPVYRDTMAVLLDPNFEDFQDGRAAFVLTEDSFEDIVAKYPEAENEIQDYLDKKQKDKEDDREVAIIHSQDAVGKGYRNQMVAPTSEGMFPVFVAYMKHIENGKLRYDYIVYINEEIILEAKAGVKPEYFPLVALYDLPPEKNPYSVGIIQRNLKNILSLNVLDSIAVTHTYASQRTPLVMDIRAGIDPNRVRKDMNNPDRLFVTNGVASKDVFHRMDYPDLPPNLASIREGLSQSIERVSGIDDEYKGRDTKSITTTGGMERLQSRISMTDNTRISMIEKYAKDLTKMMLDFYILHGGKRWFITTKSYQSEEQALLEIDFGKYKADAGRRVHTFPMSINATPLLPKNRARLAEAANTIMQFQMQYQGQIQLLTEEEWLYYQDFPQKDMILDRMKLDRLRNDMEEITGELQSFAGMTDQGVRPEEAVSQLAEERKIRREPSVMKKQLEGMKK